MQQGALDRQQDQGLVGSHQGEKPQNGDREMDGKGVAKGPVQIHGNAPAQGQGPHHGFRFSGSVLMFLSRPNPGLGIPVGHRPLG